MNEQEKPMEQVGMDEAVAAEIERRVREEVQRARAEWEAEQAQADAERERVAGMSDDERERYALSRREAALDERERMIAERELRAMALEQLKKLPGFIARRHEIAAIYDSRLAGLDWLDLPPALPADCSGTYYFYHVQTKRGSRDDLAKFLRDNDVYTTFRYFPLHRVPAYGLAGSFPNADYAADHTLCLPIHQALTDDEVNYICDKIIEFGKNNKL